MNPMHNEYSSASRILDIGEIEHYVGLQQDLITVLRRMLSSVQDWSLLLDLPTKGEIVLRSRRWRFSKHGLGVRFVEVDTGVVVDVDSELTAAPAAISAGRLAQYAESRWKVDVPISWLHRELEQMTVRGLLVRLPESRLFTLRRATTQPSSS